MKMNLDEAIKKVTETDWQDFEQCKLVNELDMLFDTLKYSDHRQVITESDIKEFFIFEDTQKVAIDMIFGGK